MGRILIYAVGEKGKLKWREQCEQMHGDRAFWGSRKQFGIVT